MRTEDAPIEILFTHPFFWPYVRRGAERGIADLGSRLDGCGHHVSLVTTMPSGITRRERLSDIDVRYVRLPIPRFARTRGVNDSTAFAAIALPWLLARGGDLVHCWLYGDAWAATRARRVRRRPTVLTLTGSLEVERMAALRIDDRMCRSAFDHVDEVWCLSEYARREMVPFGRDMKVVPLGIDLERFTCVGLKSPAPTLLCTSSPDEPRKLIIDAMRAWPLVLDVFPEARFRLAGAASNETKRRLLEPVPQALRNTVEFIGERSDNDLVSEYGAAWASLMPGYKEAQGLATLESLACGTPVAGLRSGATPELVGDDGGALYERGDVEGCATAIVACMKLNSEATAHRCRVRAKPYGWSCIVDRVLGRYNALLGQP